ncbi:MAG TPA: hypothetical protein VIX90_10605 [Edaphobacter sp.]
MAVDKRPDMIKPMFRCLPFCLMAAFPLMLVAQKKSTDPVPAYKIKIAERRSNMGTYFEVAPDQSLLFFTGDKAGNWGLNRVSAWDSPSPKQKRLKIKGPTREETESSRFGQSTFLITNDGRFALTRVALDAPGMASSFRKNSRAIINIVDLQSFTAVSTLDTTDKLLAGGFWQAFQEHSILAGYSANEKDAGGSLFSRESVALLELPTMKSAMACDYLLHYGELKQNDHGGWGRATSTSALSSGCAEIMTKTNSSEPQKIQKSRVISKEAEELKFQPQEFSGNPAWHGCSLVDERSSVKLALYDCGTGHQTWYDTSKTDSRVYFAVDVTTGTALLRVPIDPSKNATGHLATHEGKSWLALLTNDVDLAFYPIQ